MSSHTPYAFMILSFLVGGAVVWGLAQHLYNILLHSTVQLFALSMY